MRRRAILGVLLAALAASIGASCASPGGGNVTVTIKDLRFNPEVVTVAPGEKVSWVNEDSTAHTSTSADFSADATSNPPGSWSSPVLDPGDSWSRTFDKEGDFPYACSIHPYIKGTVKVKAR